MAENTTTTLSGLLKRVYGDKVTRLVPENSLITKMVPWGKSTEQLGDKFYESVNLALEQGVTYAAPGSGAFAYATPIPGATRQAEVDAYQMHIRAHLDSETATRARNAGSPQAFEKATAHVIKNMTDSIRRRLEVNFLYGGSDLGVVSGAPSGNVVTLSAASFAAGIWAGMEGAAVEFRDPTTYALQTTTTISSMDLRNGTRTITVADATNVSSGDLIYFAGSYGKEAIGMDKIITTSGSLFGINNSTYNLWKGNEVTSVGALTQEKLDDAVTEPMNKGFMGDLTLFVNPYIWADLLGAQTALRQYTEASSTMINGAKALKYYTQSGTIEVVSHPVVKIGDGFLVTKKDWKRVGACDISLGNPSTGNAWMPLENNAGVQTEAYSHQALFCTAPGFQTKLSGITKSA